MKKSNRSYCCGSYPQQTKTAPETELLPNPAVSRGVQVIYVGSGVQSFHGKISGSTYYASEHRRYFKIHVDDIPSVLEHEFVILRP